MLRAAGVTAERVEPGHFDGMCRLDGDAQVMAALGGIRPREVTAAHLAFDMEQWEEHGFGMYALVTDGEGVVGRAGLRSNDLGGTREFEIGYSLLPELWGRGIMTAVVDQIVATAALASLATSVVCHRRSGERPVAAGPGQGGLRLRAGTRAGRGDPAPVPAATRARAVGRRTWGNHRRRLSGRPVRRPAGRRTGRAAPGADPSRLEGAGPGMWHRANRRAAERARPSRHRGRQLI